MFVHCWILSIPYRSTWTTSYLVHFQSSPLRNYLLKVTTLFIYSLAKTVAPEVIFIFNGNAFFIQQISQEKPKIFLFGVLFLMKLQNINYF